MKNYIELIQETFLFYSFTPETIQEYIKNKKFRVVEYFKNNTIHYEGELCEKLEIILSGAVAIERIDKNGNILTVAELNENDVLGGNLLFSKNPYYPMTVSAKTSIKILEVKEDYLFDLLSKHPFVLKSYLELICDNAYILGNKIKNYAQKTIRESILNYLNYECKKQNSNEIVLRITKKEMAKKIGVQRTSLSRELAKMRDDGLIKFTRGIITLL
ncbi:MAG TPA: Crp/Fnr family transcriptional regulator [Paludibacter sp.]|nr:Crp/Fnr family transcriptional regulator [Paludibacter sp.]